VYGDKESAVTDTKTMAQDPDEPFDVLLADGTPTGIVKPRAAVHRDGDWHRALHIWVAGRDEAGEPFLIFQRRSSAKDSWPDHFDTTVGGHFRAGETLRETLREIEEEIGIPAMDLPLRPLGTRISITESPPLCDHELQEVFLLLDDRPLADYQPHPVELSALVRFPLRDLPAFFSGEISRVYGEAVTPGNRVPFAISATAEDFIPSVDRYGLRIAIVAQNVLRGDPYVAL
jgi:isopentenyldiphosphate isomerase